MRTFTTIFIAGISLLLMLSSTDAIDPLKKCWELQVKPLKNKFFSFHYRENKKSLYHSPEPWLTLDQHTSGKICCSTEEFQKCDTFIRGEKQNISLYQLNKKEFISQSYWSKTPSVSTDISHLTYEFCRYTPLMLLSTCIERKVKPDNKLDEAYAIYHFNIDQTRVQLFIRKSDCLLEKVITMEAHEILGDISTTYTYDNFAELGNLHYAQHIKIEKVHGITEDITISSPAIVNNVKSLLEKPADNKSDDINQKPEIVVTKLGTGIYSLNLKHVETQVGLIEFRDFFVVLDAPLSSENGELILKEAKKIAPEKPVRYFAFGHHHPWYIGGVRAFIHKGVRILCTDGDINYLQFIANAPHTIKPDSLHMQPANLLIEPLDSHVRISDGNMTLDIYRIGKKSEHTNDYSLFYLPSEKLVFEGDLVWVPKEGPAPKAGITQAGFYHAVKDLGIEVKTVVQTWPTGDKRTYKNVIPFAEIEQSVNTP